MSGIEIADEGEYNNLASFAENVWRTVSLPTARHYFKVTKYVTIKQTISLFYISFGLKQFSYRPVMDLDTQFIFYFSKTYSLFKNEL